jgi:tetratricopeptide (TPR) repeat protein
MVNTLVRLPGQRLPASAGALALLALLALVALPSFTGSPFGSRAEDARPSDYERDLAAYDAHLREAARDAATTPTLELRYRRALLVGDSAALADLASTLSTAGRADSVLSLRVDLALHRLGGAMTRLNALSGAADATAFELLRAQVLLQLGQTAEAGGVFARVIGMTKHWEAFAGLAAIEAAYGRYGRADLLYEQAADELDAKQMRAYSWVLLQRGLLRLRQGNVAEALQYYGQAEKAYSGSWLVDDYVAEALAAGGHHEEAIARYQRAIATSPRPELQQALGDLYLYLGKPDQATRWLDAAHAAYSDSIARGEPHYLHHLARFHADSRLDAAKAISLARRDLELRETAATHDMLAWALYRDSQFENARRALAPALASGVRDADIFLHAALIELALGDAAQGQNWLQQAAAINPRNGAFHVHR